MSELETQRKHIAERVRELRRSRRWTQAELAKRLELSQSRLSEIETGHGSFTAEQLLRVLALFNVGVEEFVERRNDPQQELQNALARFGAKHLIESDRIVTTAAVTDLRDVVRDVLLDGSARLVTGLAPVLSAHARELNLEQLYVALERLGRGRRLAWVVDNTLEAVQKLSRVPGAKTWQLLRLNIEVPFKTFLVFVHHVERANPPPKSVDVLDATIRTEASRDAVRKSSSVIARRWNIVTALKVDDFVEALRGAL